MAAPKHLSTYFLSTFSYPMFQIHQERLHRRCLLAVSRETKRQHPHDFLPCLITFRGSPSTTLWSKLLPLVPLLGNRWNRKKRRREGCRNNFRPPYFRRQPPGLFWWAFSSILKIWKMFVVLCILFMFNKLKWDLFVEGWNNRVLNEAKISPKPRSKIENHTLNVSLYGPVLHCSIVLGGDAYLSVVL